MHTPASHPSQTFSSSPTQIESIVGLDFSGAAKAGRTIWLAACRLNAGGLAVSSINRLDRRVGHEDRDLALAALVSLVQASDRTLWGMDFPFGLPIELGWRDWTEQLRAVTGWTGGASEFGRRCCEIALKQGPRMHVYRATDRETKTPFDCYHYRIVYQMFHGMRDVLAKLDADPSTAILPFRFDRLARARRIVVEACPGSTLKRLGLPHQNYKQPSGGPLEARRIRTRHTILDAIATHVSFEATHRRVMMRDPGGDAMDALIAAVGAWQAWQRADLQAIASHPRYPREGLVFA
jgi:hypothetical protein